MCGICGFLCDQGDDRGDALRRMTDALAHRGPDDSGLYGGGRVGLGHRRLSIIDLSPLGHQPLANEDGTIQVVFNGEIYNFGELRVELEARGHRFRGNSDTEVIPHAYEEWGLDFPRRFRGMFALALWDEREERLVLVRDRLGIKPLYYYRAGNLFLFGSELKALMAWPDFPRRIDPASLYWYLAFGYVPAPRAIFDDTRKLPPGHLLVVDRSGMSLTRWWDPLEAVARGPLPGSEAELLEELETILLEAVRYRLISDVPLGAFLSGGIDSSLVVALMARLASGPVRTFTIGYWEKGYDEAPWARAIAARLGTEHTELYIRPQEALEVIGRLPEIYDEPFGDASAIPTYLVSGLARRSVTVALSGDGGDELYGGYPRYKWFHLARLLYGVPRPLRRAMAPLVARLPHPKARKAASWLAVDDPAELYAGMVGVWRRGALRRVLGFERPFGELDFRRVWEAAPAGRHLERLMLTDLSTYLPEDILAKVDRASMAHSLEARVPLLDHHAVEFALRVPLSLKFRHLRGKHLLRRLLGRYLPSELYERPKMGFGVPLDHWFRRELRDLLRNYTDPARLTREGFFDPQPIQLMVEEHLAGRADHQYTLWVLLMFQMWLERWR